MKFLGNFDDDAEGLRKAKLAVAQQREQMDPPNNPGQPGAKVSRVGRESPLPFPEADAAVHLVNLPRNRNLPQVPALLGENGLGIDWQKDRGKYRCRVNKLQVYIGDQGKAIRWVRLVREGKSKEEALADVGIEVR